MTIAQYEQDPNNPVYPVVVFDGALETLKSMQNKEEAKRILEVMFEFSVSSRRFHIFGLL